MKGLTHSKSEANFHQNGFVYPENHILFGNNLNFNMEQVTLMPVSEHRWTEETSGDRMKDMTIDTEHPDLHSRSLLSHDVTDWSKTLEHFSGIFVHPYPPPRDFKGLPHYINIIVYHVMNTETITIKYLLRLATDGYFVRVGILLNLLELLPNNEYEISIKENGEN
ncbi:hypothetical protein KUTeg_005819 [Tegillarca granosa]|uniref:Uncharacterized protein n=1 Tax=Tegillarca granosa TaxID=220873 RepID=A0ABQ9FH42_TEGGR|nr:hypothetical protein KUTeg_005819 [Tegillarca granosa]